MTPLQLAQTECANFDTHGACLGSQIDDTGKITHCNPKPRCVLGVGERCPYFEACIAPLAGMVRDPRRAMAIQQAVHAYRMAHVGATGTARKCPDCGGAITRRKRYCVNCAKQRRKATYRDHKHATRRTSVAMSTVKPKTHPKSLGNSHGFRASCRNQYEDSHPPQNDPLTVDIRSSEAIGKQDGIKVGAA